MNEMCYTSTSQKVSLYVLAPKAFKQYHEKNAKIQFTYKISV